MKTVQPYEKEREEKEQKEQIVIPIVFVYDGITFDEGLRLEVLVEEQLICELKAMETMYPAFAGQLLTYLKLSGKRLGFLIDFNVPLIKPGVKRVVL